MGAVRIGIVGDFDAQRHSHWATEAALFHAAVQLGIKVEPRWVPTEQLAVQRAADGLVAFDVILAAPGSPYRSMPGMLRAIEYARTRDVPFLGTCGGFQYALIEFSRNVLGLTDADSAENVGAGAKNIVITPVFCDVASAVRPRLNGAGVARPVRGSLLERLSGGADLTAQYFCSYETNPDFVERWESAGLRVAALGDDGELRAFELPSNRFFVATLFQPQLSSTLERPHPILLGFLRAGNR